MDRDLIIQVLKSACGNKNFRFQVIMQKSKLHIYINRQPDCYPNYLVLTDTITAAIATLGWNELEGIWLYCRKLGEIEPDWQTYVEPPAICHQEEMDTAGSAVTEATTTSLDPDGFDEVTDSFGNTGLPEDTGLIHTKPLAETELTTLTTEWKQPTTSEIPAKNSSISSTPEVSNFEKKSEPEIKSLQEYCFVPNKKILTGDILAPEKEIIRLVKFFHHLSANNQQKILPFLADFLKNPIIPEIDNLALAVKKWLKQISQLQDEERKIVAIWLSRYCFNPEGTMEEFKQIEAKKVEQAKAKTTQPIKRTNTEYSFTPATPVVPTNFVNNQSGEDLDLVVSKKKWQFPPIILKILRQNLIPGIWTLATLVAMILGIYTSHPQTPQASQQVPKICQTSLGSTDYCRLGVNLAGEKTIQELSTSIFPLSEITESVATYGCERFANVKAERFSNLDPQTNPVLFSYGEQILPHVFVVQAVQKHASKPEQVRVGCVYTTGEGERSPKKLASEVIPLNWPSQSYQPVTISESNLSFGKFTNVVNLGLYTIFAAFGLAIASGLNLGIQITNRPQTIYLVALILGLMQLIAVNLPMLNLIASIVLPMIAIWVVSQLSKHFQLSNFYGYPLILSGILITIAVQLLFYGLFLQLIQIVI